MTLPAQLTSFVGRERERVAIARLLQQERLVTLTGPGGVGKTRLALVVAQDVAPAFGEGVVFVDLAPVSDSTAVPAAIARALGIRDDGAVPLLGRLSEALRNRALLLILDNFEHVIAAAPVVIELLQAASGVKALVTSRAALRLRGEAEFPVAPLACPSATSNESVDTLLRYPAVALFVRRAQEVRPDFAPMQGSASSVAEICRRLDGLPLALELAAARIRVLSPEAMLGRLGQRLALLTGGPRDLPARQQTQRATIAWSYELLSHEEQALFRRLAVFAGGFSLEAASSVVATSASSGAFDLVASLVEKNLLWQVEGSDHESRFRMLETVREFGLEQLEARGEAEDARRAHAAFCVRLVEEAAPHLRRRDRVAWLQRVGPEMDNLRSVVAWSGAGADGGEALVRIVCGLGWLYWRIRGNTSEAYVWGELALAAEVARTDPARRVHLLYEIGSLAGYMQRLAPARAWLKESVQVARALGDANMLGLALVLLGYVVAQMADKYALQLLDEGIATLRARGEPEDLMLALNVAVVSYDLVGAPEVAGAALSECLASARALGDDWGVAVALSNAAWRKINDREWDSAAAYLQQSLDLHLRIGDDGSVNILYNNLAVVALNQGDESRAAQLFEQSLAMQRRMGLTSPITLCHLGDLALWHDQLPLAAAYFAEAVQIASRSGVRRGMTLGMRGLAQLARAVGDRKLAVRLETAFADGDEAVAALEQLTNEALAWVEAVAWLPSKAAVDTAAGLSSRELEVLRLLARGKTNREIADALTISLNTVARHVSNIFDKVDAANRTEAAAYAHRHGIT